MKRDIRLERKLMLHFLDIPIPPEGIRDSYDYESHIKGYSRKQIDFSLRSLCDRGFLKSIDASDKLKRNAFIILGITPSGIDYIENSSPLNKVKRSALSLGEKLLYLVIGAVIGSVVTFFVTEYLAKNYK